MSHNDRRLRLGIRWDVIDFVTRKPTSNPKNWSENIMDLYSSRKNSRKFEETMKKFDDFRSASYALNYNDVQRNIWTFLIFNINLSMWKKYLYWTRELPSTCGTCLFEMWWIMVIFEGYYGDDATLHRWFIWWTLIRCWNLSFWDLDGFVVDWWNWHAVSCTCTCWDSNNLYEFVIISIIKIYWSKKKCEKNLCQHTNRKLNSISVKHWIESTDEFIHKITENL